MWAGKEKKGMAKILKPRHISMVEWSGYRFDLVWLSLLLVQMCYIFFREFGKCTYNILPELPCP